MRWWISGPRAPLRALAAWCLLILLVGCGGGVVGTGTGPGDDGSDSLPYTPVPLCSAPFKERGLRCSGDVFAGTAAVLWSDAGGTQPGAAVLATLEGETLGLQLACPKSSFLGAWGELADGSLAFVGRYYAPSVPDTGQVAIVRVEAAADPAAVGWLRVEDIAGTTLAGPWLVRRAGDDVRFKDCAA
jgi:hypothetical protein